VTYTLTVRDGPRVEHERFEDLDAALRALDARVEALSPTARRKAVQPPGMRSFEPVAQVAARLELSGPKRLRGGIDLRGDGSAEAFTGKLRRQVVEQQRGESAVDALRRVLRG
jgi:hypothetical protein